MQSSAKHCIGMFNDWQHTAFKEEMPGLIYLNEKQSVFILNNIYYQLKSVQFLIPVSRYVKMPSVVGILTCMSRKNSIRHKKSCLSLKNSEFLEILYL